MQLNGIELSTYNPRANEVTFLLDCTLGAALSLDGQTLTVTSGERAIEIFAGYSVVGVSAQGEYTQMRAMRKLDDATAAAIEGLDAGLAALGERTTDSEAVINALLTGEVM